MNFEHRITLIYTDEKGLNRHLASLIEKKGFTSGGPGPDTEDGEKTYNLYKELTFEEYHDEFHRNLDARILQADGLPLVQYREETRRAW